MLVREVMSSPVITVRRTDRVRQAIRVLHEHDITAAPVVDHTGRLVGVVSELDLLRGEFEPDPRATIRPAGASSEPPPRLVTEVMTERVTTVAETTDVTAAIDLMVSRRIKSLPVVRGDAIVGMFSRRDLISMLARPDSELREAVVTALREHYPSGPSWDVTVRDGVAELSGPPHEYDDHIADLLAHTVPGITRVRHVKEQP